VSLLLMIRILEIFFVAGRNIKNIVIICLFKVCSCTVIVD
jgi:hypothetical protein